MLDVKRINDTIAAISTAVALGQGSIAIVRVSGPSAERIGRQVFSIPGTQRWESHRIIYGHVIDPTSRERIDEALLLIMKAPRSFTGEDVIEFHCHGGLICVQRVLELVLSQGARRALPGEFSQRAVLNGRIDLTRAEAISTLIGARSRRVTQLAMVSLTGAVYKEITRIKERLLEQLAELEAHLDFEEDLLPLDERIVKNNLESIYQDLIQLVMDSNRSAILYRGLEVALIGRPNVGKSSLLNLFSRREKAIVTDLPGTTRDLLESEIIVQGVPITLVDTAGIQFTGDIVEKLGIQRSRQVMMSADAIILVFDLTEGWTSAEEDLIREIPEGTILLIAGNKSDKCPLRHNTPVSKIFNQSWIFPVSARTGEGEDSILSELLNRCGANENQDIRLSLNSRQRDLAKEAATFLNHTLITIEQNLPIDFWTIDLRQAIAILTELTGENISEVTLDRIFSRFCIGK
uniref:tRNA modification GTPase n=1 Tax=Paulinella micropora TaxID=1928728 RepID=A0A1L5YBP0_9EUKA|nr:tRNA modification GTPase [Paulinella micropora]